MLDDIDCRVMDPGRGPFCATTKQGLPLPLPPTRREPVAERERNPRGVRHPFKTFQDSQRREDRSRYQAWLKRQ